MTKKTLSLSKKADEKEPEAEEQSQTVSEQAEQAEKPEEVTEAAEEKTGPRVTTLEDLDPYAHNGFDPRNPQPPSFIKRDETPPPPKEERDAVIRVAYKFQDQDGAIEITIPNAWGSLTPHERKPAEILKHIAGAIKRIHPRATVTGVQ